jgi:hypothetical protein
VAIYRLLQNQAFEPETIAAMSAAYEDCIRSLGLRDRSDPLTALVAGRIIEYAQRGERDPIRLRDFALSTLEKK